MKAAKLVVALESATHQDDCDKQYGKYYSGFHLFLHFTTIDKITSTIKAITGCTQITGSAMLGSFIF